MSAPGCVFCCIVRGDLGTSYMDTDYHDVLAFEPLNPRKPGHLLFVPTRHVRAASTDPMVTGRVFEAAARWGAQNAADFNLLTSDGPAATQTVMHLHVHYLPRYPDDDIPLPWSNQVTP